MHQGLPSCSTLMWHFTLIFRYHLRNCIFAKGCIDSFWTLAIGLFHNNISDWCWWWEFLRLHNLRGSFYCHCCWGICWKQRGASSKHFGSFTVNMSSYHIFFCKVWIPAFTEVFTKMLAHGSTELYDTEDAWKSYIPKHIYLSLFKNIFFSSLFTDAHNSLAGPESALVAALAKVKPPWVVGRA